MSLCRVWLPPPSFPLGDMTSMVWDGKVYNTVSVGGHLETIWAEEGTTLWCGWQNKVMLISLLLENNVCVFRENIHFQPTHKTNRCTRSPWGPTRSGKSVLRQTRSSIRRSILLGGTSCSPLWALVMLIFLIFKVFCSRSGTRNALSHPTTETRTQRRPRSGREKSRRSAVSVVSAVPWGEG